MICTPKLSARISLLLALFLGSLAPAQTGTPTTTPFATVLDGSPATWAIGTAHVANATLTLVHTTSTRAINLTGLANGGAYVLLLKQDSTGGAAATLGSGCTWYQARWAGYAPLTTLALTTSASAVNVLAFIYDGTNCYANLGPVTLPGVSFSTVTDGSPATWAVGSAQVASATLTLAHATGTRAINLTGLVNGGTYVLILKQDSTGGAAATLGSGCTWYQSGASGYTALTTLALTTTASAINILAFAYDGTYCYANLH
jgi:hypothetical protein